MNFNDVWNYGIIGLFGQDKSVAILILGWVLCAGLSYLLGSLNFGMIISKYKYGDDIRKHGSGNAGATNVLRTYGKKDAAFTYLGDGLKAAIAVLIVGRMLSGSYGAYISGLFCVIGHMWPCFFGFRGGKGVATASVMILCLDPFIFLLLLIMFIAIVAFTKYVSLGSVISICIYPLFLYKIAGPGFNVITAVIVAALVVYRHKENIKRIRNGTENKLSFGKKDKKNKDKSENSTEE